MVKRGFSLIELTVVIGLLSLLMLAIVSTMLISIMSSNRIRTATRTKQAGNYAISQMQSMLRSAKMITTCDSVTPTLTLVNQDGGSTDLTFDLTTSQIASNSGVYLTPANLAVSSFALTCEPTDSTPTLVKVSFDLQEGGSESGVNNPLLHFETSTNLRNEQ